WQTQTIIAPMAVVGGNFTPSTPGTPINLLTRPLSLASLAAEAGDDPRRMPLRGSTGMPVGGMGAIADSMAASARSRGVVLRTGVAIDRILTRDDAVTGVVTADGEEFRAPVVVAAINPRLTVV